MSGATTITNWSLGRRLQCSFRHVATWISIQNDSEKEDAETQSNLGERVFDTAEELVVAVLRQLTGAQMSKDGISDSESAGWR